METSSARKLAFYCGLAVLFMRFSTLPEFIYTVTGINTYFLYLVTPPAVLGVLTTGAIQRTFRARATYFWFAFMAWLVIATPFSSWLGGSVGTLISLTKTDIFLPFIVGGIAVNWREVRIMIYTLAVSGLMTLFAARIFVRADDAGRLTLASSGSIGNSNDLAAHLLLLLPFMLFFIMDPKRSMLARILTIGAIAYGLKVVVGTGSRGALVALGVAMVFYLLRATMRQRVAVVAIGPILAVALIAFLPDSTKQRLGNLFGKEHAEAEESGLSRSYLFWQSVRFTIEHPIVGVGPGQFSNFEGKWSKDRGGRGNWHETHCTWTQVSSECGIPALLFYVCAIIAAWRLVSRTYRRARDQGNLEVANVCFCYMLAMVAFFTAVTFLAQAYRFYTPALVGLAIAIKYGAEQQLNLGEKRKSSPAAGTAYR